MLEFIKKDHRNMQVLLDVLQQKVAALKQEQPVRYSLIRDILEYLKNFSGKYHHPHEDIIYNYYLTHKSQQSNAINHLEAEHKAIAEATEQLCTTVEMILLDAIVPLEQFVEQLEGFIQQQLQHMRYEDQQILPALEQELDEQDWQAIIAGLPYAGLKQGLSINQLMEQLDPLFGKDVAEQYQALHERILGGE